MGGAGVFEAMTVGAILALKFDLWFFYGVPITSDLEAATIDDDRFKTITLETFDGPIYFDMEAIGDNPVQPIYSKVILPVAMAVKGLGAAHQKIEDGHSAYVEAFDGGKVSAKRRATLRKRARRRLAEGRQRPARRKRSSRACRYSVKNPCIRKRWPRFHGPTR